MKHWNTPIYAFFKPTPAIDLIAGRRAHVFSCSAKVCKGKGRHGQDVRRYLNTADVTSTSNLRRHAKACWGEETVAAAGSVKDVYAARIVLAKSTPRDGSITAAFERLAKDKRHSRTGNTPKMNHGKHQGPHNLIHLLRTILPVWRPFDGWLRVCVLSK
jgi:hypothetical protein